jgi:hypothetical protein
MPSIDCFVRTLTMIDDRESEQTRKVHHRSLCAACFGVCDRVPTLWSASVVSRAEA